MCGIAGFVSTEYNESTLRGMTAKIAHRGPDAEGFYFERPFGLGHRRLSIIDLSAESNQPMYSSDGNWVIIFNGEIYNYQQLRSQLIQDGCDFKTHSDTEVVLQTIIRKGVNGVKDFIGMFAFAIWNKATQTICIFRDRIGVKPLYYGIENKNFFFASEIKGLYDLLNSKEIDTSSVADFFRFGYARKDKTIYKKIRKLLPGHYLEIDAALNIKIEKYWEAKPKSKPLYFSSEEEAIDRLEALMTEAFNYRMVADVPVGIFLSGGIDSSTVAALLAKNNKNLKTFSIGFDDPRYNEAHHAAEVAKVLGTQHHEKILTAADAAAVMEHYFEIFDEPFADSSGIPVFLISHFAKQEGCKVVLSADGGDELFGGYDRYKDLPALFEKLQRRKNLVSLLRGPLEVVAATGFQRKNIQHKTQKLLDLTEELNNYSDQWYERHIGTSTERLLQKLIYGYKPDAKANNSETGLLPVESMMYWDLKNYLPDDLLSKVDKASMATSIEAREPFLDHRLVDFAFNLPAEWRMGKESKYLLRKILYRYVPKKLFDRPKMGFSIPLFKWFSQQLDAEFEPLFSKSSLDSIPVINTAVARYEYEKYKKFKAEGKEYNMLFMWHLYVFVKWWKRWME
jgi:asparagine synthase (glutamine-hydrolysing)